MFSRRGHGSHRHSSRIRVSWWQVLRATRESRLARKKSEAHWVYAKNPPTHHRRRVPDGDTHRLAAPLRGSQQWKRIRHEISYLFLVAAAAGLVCLLTLTIVSSRIVAATDLAGHVSNPSGDASVAGTPGATPSPDAFSRVLLTGIPASAAFLDVSFDNRYYCYESGGKLHLFNVDDAQQLDTVSAPKPISYSLMINDSDLVMYFYKSGNALHINTYNIVTKKTLSYKPFTVAAGTKIAGVSYAVSTNLVYVVMRGGGTDTVYQIDVMNVVTKHPLTTAVANFVPSATTLNSYFQNTGYALYYNFAPARQFAGKKVELLGRDSKDNFYLLSRTTPNHVEVLHSATGKITRGFGIPAGAQRFLSTPTALYAVYADRIVDLEDPSLTPVLFNATGRFVTAVGKTLYFLPPA